MNTEPSSTPIVITETKMPKEAAFHGGAWKVAYADFVTAMMAFFLLLWLLSTADEATLSGIAEYFEPTIGVKDSLGIGFEGGESPEDVVDIQRSEQSPVGIVVGDVKQGPVPTTPERDTPIEAEEESDLFNKAEEAIERAFESDPSLRDLTENIIVEQKPEGLEVQVADSDKYSMFESGSSELSKFGQMILSKMLPIIEAMPNYISITGHTDVAPHSKITAEYTNWELSSDRAHSARRFLLKAGMDPERTQKVLGKAGADLLVPEQPKSPKNRRVSIILLRGNYMDMPDWSVPAARGLLTVPGGEHKNSVDKLLERVDEKREELRKEKATPKASQLPDFYRDALPE